MCWCINQIDPNGLRFYLFYNGDLMVLFLKPCYETTALNQTVSEKCPWDYNFNYASHISQYRYIISVDTGTHCFPQYLIMTLQLWYKE